MSSPLTVGFDALPLLFNHTGHSQPPMKFPQSLPQAHELLALQSANTGGGEQWQANDTAASMTPPTLIHRLTHPHANNDSQSLQANYQALLAQIAQLQHQNQQQPLQSQLLAQLQRAQQSPPQSHHHHHHHHLQQQQQPPPLSYSSCHQQSTPSHSAHADNGPNSSSRGVIASSAHNHTHTHPHNLGIKLLSYLTSTDLQRAMVNVNRLWRFKSLHVLQARKVSVHVQLPLIYFGPFKSINLFEAIFSQQYQSRAGFSGSDTGSGRNQRAANSSAGHLNVFRPPPLAMPVSATATSVPPIATLGSHLADHSVLPAAHAVPLANVIRATVLQSPDRHQHPHYHSHTLPLSKKKLRENQMLTDSKLNSLITCGVLIDTSNNCQYKQYNDFFGKSVEVYTAVNDPLQSVLYRASALAEKFNYATNKVGMYLSRRRLNGSDGIYQAIGFIDKPPGRTGLKYGGYFLTLEACKEFENHFKYGGLNEQQRKEKALLNSQNIGSQSAKSSVMDTDTGTCSPSGNSSASPVSTSLSSDDDNENNATLKQSPSLSSLTLTSGSSSDSDSDSRGQGGLARLHSFDPMTYTHMHSDSASLSAIHDHNQLPSSTPSITRSLKRGKSSDDNDSNSDDSDGDKVKRTRTDSCNSISSDGDNDSDTKTHTHTHAIIDNVSEDSPSEIVRALHRSAFKVPVPHRVTSSTGTHARTINDNENLPLSYQQSVSSVRQLSPSSPNDLLPLLSANSMTASNSSHFGRSFSSASGGPLMRWQSFGAPMRLTSPDGNSGLFSPSPTGPFLGSVSDGNGNGNYGVSEQFNQQSMGSGSGAAVVLLSDQSAAAPPDAAFTNHRAMLGTSPATATSLMQSSLLLKHLVMAQPPQTQQQSTSAPPQSLSWPAQPPTLTQPPSLPSASLNSNGLVNLNNLTLCQLTQFLDFASRMRLNLQ